MSRKRPIFVTWDASPYSCYVTLALGATVRQIARYLEAEGYEVDDDIMDALGMEPHQEALTTEMDGHVVMRFSSPTPAPNFIAHEALHATAAILRRASLPLSEDSEEAWAYLLDSIVERVTASIR